MLSGKNITTSIEKEIDARREKVCKRMDNSFEVSVTNLTLASTLSNVTMKTSPSMTSRPGSLYTFNTASSKLKTSSVASAATEIQLLTTELGKQKSTLKSETDEGSEIMAVTADRVQSTFLTGLSHNTITFEDPSTGLYTITTAGQRRSMISKKTRTSRISTVTTKYQTTTSAAEIPTSPAGDTSLTVSTVEIQSTELTTGSSPSVSSEEMPATSEFWIENRTMTLFAEQIFSNSTDESVTVFYSSANNDLCVNQTFTAVACDDNRIRCVKKDFIVYADGDQYLKIEGLSPAIAYKLRFESHCTFYQLANPLEIFTGK